MAPATPPRTPAIPALAGGCCSRLGCQTAPVRGHTVQAGRPLRVPPARLHPESQAARAPEAVEVAARHSIAHKSTPQARIEIWRRGRDGERSVSGDGTVRVELAVERDLDTRAGCAWEVGILEVREAPVDEHVL